MELEPGTLVAEKYRILRCLGRGGMGLVYAASNEWTGREVVVKAMQAHTSTERFLREVRATASLKHPNIVDVLDLVKEDRGLYLVLERLLGQTLQELLEVRGRLGLKVTVEIILPILDALEVVHARGLVHRDIKPSNLFLAEVGGSTVPKLIDFGISQLPGVTPLTSTGQALGTVGYMAPEQLMAQPSVAATDLWAIGLVLYECLTGRVAFDPTKFGPLGALGETGPDFGPLQALAPSVAGLVRACLARRPEERVRSAADLAVSLKGALAEQTNSRFVEPTTELAESMAALGESPTELAESPGQPAPGAKIRLGRAPKAAPVSGFALRLREGGRGEVFPLPLADVKIGGEADCWLLLEAASQGSAAIAQMRPIGPTYALLRLAGAPVRRNGILISGEVVLMAGDRVTFGSVELVFERLGATPAQPE
jgi:serine/threonine protein kinase